MSSRLKATLSAGAHGSRSAWVTYMAYGPNIEIPSSESRFGSAVYPRHITASSFRLRLVFSTWRDANEFSSWVESYQRKVSEPDNTLSLMRVSVPARNFSRLALPLQGGSYGDRTDSTTHEFNLAFEGISDPVRPGDLGTTMEPSTPSTDAAIANFYPTSDLKTSKPLADDGLFGGGGTLKEILTGGGGWGPDRPGSNLPFPWER